MDLGLLYHRHEVVVACQFTFYLDELFGHGFHEIVLQKVMGVGPQFVVFDKHLGNEVPQIIRVEPWNGFLFLLDNFVDKTQQVVSRKRVFQSAQLVYHASERPNVGLVGVGDVLANFRARLGFGIPHVVRCPNHRVRVFHRAF